MSENGFKVDINIPQKDIEKMAKQVIREIIETRIEEAMKNINIEKVINDKINSSTTKLPKLISDAVKGKVDSIKYQVTKQFNEIMRSILMEEIEKKPLSGNIYLKLDRSNIETDYDDWD